MTKLQNGKGKNGKTEVPLSHRASPKWNFNEWKF
jgi:hypothetical protein